MTWSLKVNLKKLQIIIKQIQTIILVIPTATYKLGYINQGDSPINVKYEYLVFPETSTAKMVVIHSVIQEGDKPYIVHQQNSNAHIVEYMDKKYWGYSIFSNNKG